MTIRTFSLAASWVGRTHILSWWVSLSISFTSYAILLARSKIMVVGIRTLKTSQGKEREREIQCWTGSSGSCGCIRFLEIVFYKFWIGWGVWKNFWMRKLECSASINAKQIFWIFWTTQCGVSSSHAWVHNTVGWWLGFRDFEAYIIWSCLGCSKNHIYPPNNTRR